MIEQLANTLCYISAKNLVHGDLSPDNIMVNYEPLNLRSLHTPAVRPLSIIDFGGAGYVGDPVLLYKQKYSAPELIGFDSTLRMKPEYDMYSFAVIACELLLGRKLPVENSVVVLPRARDVNVHVRVTYEYLQAIIETVATGYTWDNIITTLHIYGVIMLNAEGHEFTYEFE